MQSLFLPGYFSSFRSRGHLGLPRFWWKPQLLGLVMSHGTCEVTSRNPVDTISHELTLFIWGRCSCRWVTCVQVAPRNSQLTKLRLGRMVSSLCHRVLAGANGHFFTSLQKKPWQIPKEWIRVFSSVSVMYPEKYVGREGMPQIGVHPQQAGCQDGPGICRMGEEGFFLP